jgi:hypothetical protein
MRHFTSIDTSFQYGNPNGGELPTWAAYDAEAEPYLDLGDRVQLKHHLLEEQVDLLEPAQQRLRDRTSRAGS